MMNSFPLSLEAPCSLAAVLQGKIKVWGKFQSLLVIFASFCCSPSPNFAELHCCIGKLSLKFLPIPGFPGATSCVPVQMELLPSLFSLLQTILAS